MLLIVIPLFFAAISATPLFPNTTTETRSSISSPSSTSSSYNGLITSGVTSAYYDPYDFLNPYFFIIINTSGDLVISSLQSCSAIWSSSFTQWLATAEVTTGPIVPGTTYTTTLLPWISSQAASTETFNGSLSTWTSTIPSTMTTIFPATETVTSAGYGPLYYVQDNLGFTASEPCCESCTLYGGSVQVYYWPKTEIQSPVSTLVNSAGFSFVSPSVYVAFESLYAADLCGDVGRRYSSTTLAFSPGELSTSIGFFIDNSLAWEVPLAWKGITWTQATFGDQTDCEDKFEVFWNIGGMGFSDFAAASSAASSLLSEFPMPGIRVLDIITTDSFTYNPCKPTLSVPTQVLTLNSLWDGCLPPVTALFDPPYILSAGNGLVAFAPTSTASPGPTPEPETASVTVSTSPAPAKSSTPPVVPPSSIPAADPSASGVVVVASTPILGASSGPPSSSPGGNPSASGVVVLASTPILGASSGPPSSTLTEIHVVQVVSIDSSTLLPSSNPPAQVVSDSAGTTPGAAIPVAGSPTASDPGQPDQLQNPASQSLATASSPLIAVITTQAPSQISSIPGSDSANAVASVEYVISSQTLRTNGPAITVAGTVISLLPGATSLLVGTETVALGSLIGATTYSAASIGGIIISFGGFATNTYTSTTSVTATANGNYNGTLYLGGAARTVSETWSFSLLLGVGVLYVCWL